MVVSSIDLGERTMGMFRKSDAFCIAKKLPDGRYQGKVVAIGSWEGQRSEKTFVCPEIDDTAEAATRRAVVALNSDDWSK